MPGVFTIRTHHVTTRCVPRLYYRGLCHMRAGEIRHEGGILRLFYCLGQTDIVVTHNGNQGMYLTMGGM